MSKFLYHTKDDLA